MPTNQNPFNSSDSSGASAGPTQPERRRAILTRVRALLAKAESSDYPDEAAAFMAKAQQLIDEYAIDQASLRGLDTGSVGHETIAMTGSYSKERSFIWQAVTSVNRCELLTLSRHNSNKVTELTLVGRAHDRELVQLLATSLELQAMRQMTRLDTSRAFETPVVQRRSFLRGFALEVAERLKRAQRETTLHETVTRRHAVEQALVLASTAVTSYVDENFDVGRAKASRGRFDGAAFSRGRRAGAVADVGGTRLGGSRRSLPPG